MVYPIVVRKRKRLSGQTEVPKAIKLVNTKQVGPHGVLIITYLDLPHPPSSPE